MFTFRVKLGDICPRLTHKQQGQLNTEEEANLYRVSMERFFPRVESVLTGRLRPLVYFETVLDFVVMHALFKPEVFISTFLQLINYQSS